MSSRISLSLVSHTNVGKTSLARTLLGRDVGEVRDAPHVTDRADEHELLRSPAGDVLALWDTPGFGDSTRLAQRLRHSGNPIGWFLSEVWDRWRDRPTWASQQALRNVRERADVVLYLVNAAEDPAAAGYVAPEMELLAWIGKPVLVLLNQLGAPRAAAEDEADLRRWREHLARHAEVRQVLPMDAFARCWVQEGVLWAAVAGVIDESRRPAMAGLQGAWAEERLATFAASMQALAGSLGRIATAQVPFDDGGLTGSVRQTLRQWGESIGLPNRAPDPHDQAHQTLVRLIDDELRGVTDALISLHGLSGQAREQALALVATRFELRRKVDEGRAALLGGAVSGALAGLKADIASGGLTLGGGLLAGSVLGALGAAGAARGLNLARGTERNWVGCSAEALTLVMHTSLLRYLAVAHFGRGRGAWVDGEAPPHWVAAVQQATEDRQLAITSAWQGRRAGADNADAAERLADTLEPVLAGSTRAALEQLYPGTWPTLDAKTS